MYKMTEQELCIKLVEAVEKRPCLYNYHMKDYSRKDVVDRNWLEIAEEINENVTKCKEKWRNIRTCFTRSIKVGPSGELRKKPYYLTDRLQFLLPYVKTNLGEYMGNSDASLSFLHDASENSESIEYNMDEKAVPNETDFPTFEIIETELDKQPSSSHKRKHIELANNDNSFVNYCIRNMEKPEDPRRQFLLSLLPDLEKMNDREIRQFKRRAIEVIEDIFEKRSK